MPPPAHHPHFALGDEPPLLLSLPQDPLLHIISLLDVVDLLKFEAAAKSAAPSATLAWPEEQMEGAGASIMRAASAC